MNKKGIAPLVAIIMLVASLITILSFTGIIPTGDLLGTYEQVYKQQYGHVCCIEGAYETLDGPFYADYKTSTTCSEYVDKCDVIITGQVTPSIIQNTIDAEYKICNVDGSSCSSWISKILKKGESYVINLEVGKKIEFRQNWPLIYKASKYYNWERKGKLYSLIAEENGKIFSGGSGTCYLTNELKGKVLSESPNPIPKGFSYCQNYFTDFISVATQTYSYNGQKVICQAKQIYNVLNKQLENGDNIKVQGDKIASVECCPTEPNCGDDFKFHEIIKRECAISSECANGGDPYPVTQTSAKYYICENNICISYTLPVECTSNAVCQQRYGQGYVCSLTSNNYGKCIKSEGPFCGDGYCDIGESKSTCSADCELECMEGERLITQEKKINCLIGWPLNIGCETIIEKSCVEPISFWTTFFKIIIYIIIVIIILILILWLGKPILGGLWHTLRGFLKSIPFIGWLIP